MKFLEFVQRKNYLFILFLSIVVSAPLLLPYMHSGYFPTHDGEWAVVRLGDMYRELKDLQFPARYSGNLNFGYGYPLFEFAYPLPYYLGFFIHLFHVSFVTSIKLLFAVSVPLSFFCMYFFAEKFWNNRWAAFFCGIVYVYYPYRIVDLFVRGSIGESLAFVLFPCIFYFLLSVHKDRRLRYAIFAGICISLLITVHNIMAVEFLPAILLYMGVSLLTIKRNKGFLSLLYFCTLCIGFGISCFFWLPALLEKNLIALSVIPIADKSLYFVQPLQLILPSWGYGTLNISYQLGIPQVIVIFCAGFLWWIYRKEVAKDRFKMYLLLSLSLLGCIYIFLLFSCSAFFWQHIPFFSDITYPWTLLAPLGFFISVFAGKLILEKRSQHILVMIIIVGAVLYCLPYAHPSAYINHGDAYYLTNDATTTSSDEYMPLWVREKPTNRPDAPFIALGSSATFRNQFTASNRFLVTTQASKPFTLQINTIYYPGWIIMIDGTKTPFSYRNSKGVMQVIVPAGSHIIKGKFTETPLRLFSDIITLISIVLMIGLLSMSFRKAEIGDKMIED